MLARHVSRAIFKICHGNQLVYNTCWEDPRLDRVALGLGEGDRLLMITSAGCNALDYALDEPERIDTVDMNPRQNALLELKKAGIRRLEYDDFFQIFGRGVTDDADWDRLYQAMRGDLPPEAQRYWDKNGKFFLGGRRSSFYFRGSAGMFAWGVNTYINRWAKVREEINALLAAETLEEQKRLHSESVKPAFWGPWIKWAIRRDATLSLLGVPRAQRRQLERYYPGGIVKFVEDRLDTVFSELPIKDNYFWRVYLTGEYTPECCPEYLKEDNFQRLKGGLVDRVRSNTATILDFLRGTTQGYSHYVLLDHMDWLAEHHAEVLADQWQEIVDHADEGARILWRSAAVICDFVDPIKVRVGDQTRRLGEVLEYDRELADELHAKDRVNTYGSFAITTLRKSQPTAASDTAAASGASQNGASANGAGGNGAASNGAGPAKRPSDSTVTAG